MKLLAFETSGSEGTIALAFGEQLLERSIPTPREQSDLVLPLVAELLAAAELELEALDAIVFGRGPGSFTGLRVAAAVGQGLALSSGRPIVGVSSMAAIAQRAFEARGIQSALVCVDARMGEVYWGVYRVREGVAECDGDERLAAPERVRAPSGSDWSALGSGFSAFAGPLARHARQARHVLADLEPRARDLLPRARADVLAGRFLAPAEALPVYLRDADAWR